MSVITLHVEAGIRPIGAVFVACPVFTMRKLGGCGMCAARPPDAGYTLFKARVLDSPLSMQVAKAVEPAPAGAGPS